MDTAVQFLLIFFWAVPVGVASAMVSFETLEKEVPFLKNCENVTYVDFFHKCLTSLLLHCTKLFYSGKTWSSFYRIYLWFFINCCCGGIFCTLANGMMRDKSSVNHNVVSLLFYSFNYILVL